jgi:predicted anti-sigma-YlaC factor YlaD
MSACAEYLPLLSDQAAGEGSPADQARLADHLQGCAACRAEAEALAAVLSLAALPPPSEAERAALTGLAESVRMEQRRTALRLRPPLRYAAALLAVAAAVAFLLAPAFTRRGPTAPPLELAVAESADWVAPDADELWTASELAADDGSTAALSGADELALAALLTE